MALRHVSFENNQITGLPPGLGNLPLLDSLNLENNHLSSLPGSIGNLTSLTRLYLRGNTLLSLPLELTDTSVYVLDIRWNAVDPVDPELRELLDRVQPTWLATQTVAPLAVDFSRVSDTTAWVSWWPIDYVFDPGGYEVFVRTFPDGQWQSAGWTENKFVTAFPVAGLDPGVTYDVQVGSFTHPHFFNQHYLTSNPSWVITATTSTWGCDPPEITVQGYNPVTLSASPGAWSYLWSTGETTDQITVSPEDSTWYWVTTVNGSCEETASVLVYGARVFLDGFESGDMTAWDDVIVGD